MQIDNLFKSLWTNARQPEADALRKLDSITADEHAEVTRVGEQLTTVTDRFLAAVALSFDDLTLSEYGRMTMRNKAADEARASINAVRAALVNAEQRREQFQKRAPILSRGDDGHWRERPPSVPTPLEIEKLAFLWHHLAAQDVLRVRASYLGELEKPDGQRNALLVRAVEEHPLGLIDEPTRIEADRRRVEAAGLSPRQEALDWVCTVLAHLFAKADAVVAQNVGGAPDRSGDLTVLQNERRAADLHVYSV